METKQKIMNKMTMFATYSEDDLIKYIENLSKKEKSLAYLIYGLTWNMIAEKLNNS